MIWDAVCSQPCPLALSVSSSSSSSADVICKDFAAASASADAGERSRLRVAVMAGEDGVLGAWDKRPLWWRFSDGYRWESDPSHVARIVAAEHESAQQEKDTDAPSGRHSNDEVSFFFPSGDSRTMVSEAQRILQTHVTAAATMANSSATAAPDHSSASAMASRKNEADATFVWFDMHLNHEDTCSNEGGAPSPPMSPEQRSNAPCLASLKDIDDAAAALFESLPPRGLLVVVTQASLVPMRRLQERRTRARWEQRSRENRRSLADGATFEWGDTEEAEPKALATACMEGAVFLAEKPAV